MTAAEVKQIKIGQHMFGIVGLEDAFTQIAAEHADRPDEEIARLLVACLAKKNYIPENVSENYGRAFVREFRRFHGHTVGAEESIGLTIKVLGAGCNVCDNLENSIMETLAALGLAADLEHIREADQIARYRVTGIPALVINDKVMCVGRSPSFAELRQWLQGNNNRNVLGGEMDKQVFIKNIPFSEPQQLAELVTYEAGRVVSRTFAQNPALSLTLFAFDAGEGVSTHTAPGDAMVQVLDGEATINIDGQEMTAGPGEVVVMPANVPHAVTAVKRFKMILTVVKQPVTIKS
ncbi:MAG: cupin domain-containing protein [Desulfobacterales bacterium]|nr:cupin domain-containing protein [Desulfobacterales bacterium]